MSHVFYIILGLTLIIAINYGATVAVVFFYFYLAKIKETVTHRLKLALWLSLSNVVAQFLGLVVFSSLGGVAFSVITFLLSLAGYLGVMKFGYKYHIFENLIIAGVLSIILNPAWLQLFGLM